MVSVWGDKEGVGWLESVRGNEVRIWILWMLVSIEEVRMFK